MYEMMRVIVKTEPKYVITENVKNLLADKFRPQLEEYLCFLSDNGYEVTMDILNAKDYSIPQSRERIFILAKKIDK
jgi:DNA (cytosine-5)-methyltransferase 1